TEKVIARTTTSKKLLKRYGGGQFSFKDVKPGNYKLRIITGEEVDINHRFEVVKETLDLGTLYPFNEFPIYTPADYTDTTLVLIRRIPTIPVPEDSINIRHIIVDLNGNANTIIVDSIVRDSVYYTDFDNLKKHVIDLDKVYFIYNDYGIFIYQSRSMKDRMKELQHRDGFMVFHSGDTLQFDNIFFEPIKNNPEVGTFHKADTTTAPRYHALMDIYYVKTGKSFLENSVRKGFYLGLISVLSGDYGTIITVVPIVTLGKVGYDWYKDKRSNYFLPSNENTPFPINMFVFSFPEWVWKKSQPIIKPIMNSRLIKWWKGRKLRKVQKKAAKRKSASG
ncbi:MAG: hypothetical protein QGI00_10325, partial [Candidatus Marinimicrobia bacterium]|nr:hypothetical protein [Candidatus Neomarinimicrobiota bacterium]